MSEEVILERIDQLEKKIESIENEISDALNSKRSTSKSNISSKVWENGQPATAESAKVVSTVKKKGSIKTREASEIFGVTDKPTRKRMRALADNHPCLSYVETRRGHRLVWRD